jgi:hypothetical protein
MGRACTPPLSSLLFGALVQHDADDTDASFPDDDTAHAAELPHRRLNITYRASALGRRRPHRAMLCQYTRKDRHRDLRQPRSK